MKLDSYYGPTTWDPHAGNLWHRDCPDTAGAGHDGQIWYWKDGSATCTGCNGYEDGEQS